MDGQRGRQFSAGDIPERGSGGKHLEINPDPVWTQLLREKQISEQEFSSAAKKFNNVIKEYRMEVKVIKEKTPGQFHS